MTVSLRNLDDAYTRCRTFGHAWDEANPLDNPYTAQVFSWVISLRCTRCSTWRHDGINSYGDVAQRYYDYPEKYKLAEKVSRAEFRLELKRRDSAKRKRERRNRLEVVT